MRAAALTTRPLQIAIVYPGDRKVRRLATRENNRFAAVFAAFGHVEWRRSRPSTTWRT